MDAWDQVGSMPGQGEEWDDRVTALERRLLAHDQADQAAAYRLPVAAAIALAGIALAGVTAFTAAPLFAVLAAAAILVLFGLGNRVLAGATTVSLIAAALVAFIFIPALNEMNDRAEKAVNGFVGTVTSTDGLYVSAPSFPTYGAIVIPTYAPIDIDNDHEAIMIGS